MNSEGPDFQIAQQMISDANFKVGQEINGLFGDKLSFQTFQYMVLCDALLSVFVCAPDIESSDEMINAAIAQARNHYLESVT